MFLTEFEESNLEIFEKNLKLNRLPNEKKYINSQYETMLSFITLCYAIGRYTVYRQVKKEVPNELFKFADLTLEIGSKTLTVDQYIETLEGLMNLEEGSIFNTVIADGGEDFAKAAYGKSYSVFVEKINSKMLKAEIVSYSTWLESLVAEGIDLNTALGNAGYWQTVYETNMSSFYSYGRLVETDRLKEYIKFEKYNAIMDAVTTAICQDLNGKTRKVGEWNGYYPPNHYNCRSIVDIITKYRAGVQGLKADSFNLNDVEFPDKNFNRVFNIKELTKELLRSA